MISPAALAHYNWLMMQRPPVPPRVVGPWHSSSVHENYCACERCRHLQVNAFAEVKP